MKSGIWKHVTLAFLVALAVYALFFSGIEHRRARRGPWHVMFTAESGAPAILINQPKLQIRDVRIVFAGETVPSEFTPTLVAFDEPRQWPYDAPFGTVVFMDTTFLPGNVTLDLFGHEIQLLPRVLTIDKTEHAWNAGQTITLSDTTKRPVNAQ